MEMASNMEAAGHVLFRDTHLEVIGGHWILGIDEIAQGKGIG